MKITIYELLVMVKDGKAPKKVKYINSIWEYDKKTKDYFNGGLWLIYSMNSIGLTEREVEILEEEKKIPEKLEILPNNEQYSNEILYGKIKEILEDVKRHLDYVNYTGLKSTRDNEMKVMYDYITNLEQENENLHIKLEDKANEQIKTMYEEYKSRIDKAIEYIEERFVYVLKDESFLDHDDLVERRIALNLLNILKGDNK